ncbi:MAG: transglutaminase domain-containing protein [Nitrospirae bacterium]|nr:transglutaminase domain-containing protein [Nitrospirota bacterium]
MNKEVFPEELYKGQWMGLYYKGEKTGYSYREVEKTTDGYRISEQMKMRLNVMNVLKDIDTFTGAYLDPDLKLKSFDFMLNSDVTMNIKGRVDGKNLNVSMETAGTKSEQVIALKDELSLNVSVIPNIIKEGIKLGRKLSMTVIDPITMTQERILVEVEGKERIMSMNVMREVFRLKGSFKGIEFSVWLTEKGEVLREESPLEFVLIKETEDDAMQIGKPSMDIITQVAVPFNLKLPSDAKYLRVKLSGIDLKVLELDGGRQNLKGDVLETRKEEVQSPKFKAESLKSLDKYLKETVFIQAKDPEIISMAKEIVKDERDALKKARLIYEWVYRNIKKTPAITIPMATEVLKSRRGDCNEHTTLYTALARAAEIPTRIALGLTYKDGYFYYHAWPEIFIGQWIAIDPTLGQFPADAAHIRITTGEIDKQMQILSVIGKISIEGLEYR